MSEEVKIYRSRVDAWIVIFIVGTLVGVLVAIAIASSESGDWRPFLFAMISMILPVGLIAALSVPLRYELTDSSLNVQSGVIKWEVPIESIREIRKSCNPLSAPAWSLKRIRIDYDNNGHDAWILISPLDRDAFIADLETRQDALKSE